MKCPPYCTLTDSHATSDFPGLHADLLQLPLGLSPPLVVCRYRLVVLVLSYSTLRVPVCLNLLSLDVNVE